VLVQRIGGVPFDASNTLERHTHNETLVHVKMAPSILVRREALSFVYPFCSLQSICFLNFPNASISGSIEVVFTV
jgi:hypothetical protein